jgi:hypothetical protein
MRWFVEEGEDQPRNRQSRETNGEAGGGAIQHLHVLQLVTSPIQAHKRNDHPHNPGAGEGGIASCASVDRPSDTNSNMVPIT